MAVDQDLIEEQGITASEHKRTTFGTGLLKGLGITLRHLLRPAVTMQYPDERDDYPARSRGVIALKIENCTVCMLCARECPDWCIYIEGHKQEREPVSEGKRAKKFNVLDRFAIDYALCMYCGICVEVCPYDALFWSPEYEYADSEVVELTHEMDKLADWMTGVLPPMMLDEGAQGPVLKIAAPVVPVPAPPAAAPPAQGGPSSSGGLAGSAPEAGSTGPSEPPRTPPKPKLDPELVYKAVLKGELAAGNEQKVAEARARTASERIKEEEIIFGTQAAAQVSPPAAQAPAAAAAAGPEAPTAPAPTEAPAAEVPAAAAPSGAGASAEEAAAVRKQVHEQELAKGSDPRVAEGRAKAAEMRALKGTKGPS